MSDRDVLVKICGLTSPEEAQWVSENGADMAGMVLFFPKSKRCIGTDRAREIMDALSPEIKRVAVVVSPSEEQVRELCGMGFDLLQIHGQVEDRVLDACDIPIIKAFNVTDLGELDRFAGDDRVVGFVFDAAKYGGGKTFDWSLLEGLDTRGKLVILAGGLGPENVAQAIREVRPGGVDVSSGVERADGQGKDPERIRAFIRAARGL